MSQIKVNAINDASGGSNAVLYGVAAPANSMGFRNRIINGGMLIDQRNAGGSVAIGTGATFGVDRWQSNEVTDGAMTVQRSSVAPVGFSYSQLFTTTTADASLANDQYVVTQQKIEGFNSADLGWGTASAQAITLSFWVRSSLTGTFGGVFQNDAGNRTYPFTYTISASNTWEQKIVTVAGDTTGTWLTTNVVGIRLIFDLGSGPNLRGTAGAWAASGVFGVTGAVSPINTNGATWQITGVQLEAGSVASPFERRDYGRELMMCQRYYQKVAGGIATTSTGTTDVGTSFCFPVEMRSSPGVSLSAPLRVTRVNTADFVQSSASVLIAASGADVSSSGVRVVCPNFSGLPSDTALPIFPAYNGAGVFLLSSEL